MSGELHEQKSSWFFAAVGSSMFGEDPVALCSIDKNKPCA